MSQFEQKEVLFKHTTSRAEAVNTSSPDWQENVIYFVEDSSNKCGTIFLNGIPYTSTNVGFSEEVVGYTLQNVASGNYVINEKYIYSNRNVINTTLVTSKVNNKLELVNFSRGGDFGGLPKNVKSNDIKTVYTNSYVNVNTINNGSTDKEFNFCLSNGPLAFNCMYAVDSYDSTDVSHAQDVYYLWKHNQTGCGVLCENVNENGVSYLDLYKTGDNGSQPFEARDGNPNVAFIWGLSAEERKKFQWIIKPAYSSKSQWHPQGDFNEQGTYKIDDLVSYNNALYLCIKDYDTTNNNTSVIYPTDTTYWKEVFKATSSAYRGEYKYEKWGKYNTNDVVFVGTSIYICKDTYSMDDEELSDPSNKIHWAEILRFPSSKTALQYRGEYNKGTSENPSSYNKNDIVDDQGTHYICLKDYKTPPEAFNNEDSFVPYLNTVAWRLKEDSEIVLCGAVENLTGGTVVNEGEILRVNNNNTCYKCKKTHTPGPNVDLNNTEYWEPLSNTIYLSQVAAQGITAESIGGYTGKDVLYQINNKTYTDSRRFVYCNTYNYTGSSESVVNPYNSPYDTISLGLPYWKVFSITNTDNERYISYASLKDLVSRKLLNPFITYVLTDYLSKNYSGRGSNFYIKLKALDNKTLSEHCTFAKDPNNNYFEQNNLESWEGKYILNPSDVATDPSHYQHIGGCNGTIIYLKDEFNNEGDYDFKHNFAFIDEIWPRPHYPGRIADSTLTSAVHDNKFFKYNNTINLYSVDAHHNTILLNENISNVTIRTIGVVTGVYASMTTINNINIDFSTGTILNSPGSKFNILLHSSGEMLHWLSYDVITNINIYNSKFIGTSNQYSLTLHSNLNIVNSSIQGVRSLRDSDINNSTLLIENQNDFPLSFNIKNSTFRNGVNPITISFNGDENQLPKIAFSANGLNLQSNIVVDYNALDNITYKLDSSLQKLASDITIELPNGIDISDVVSNELIVYAPSDKRYLVINPFASKESISIQEQASIELDSYLGKNNKAGVILGSFYSQLQGRITSGSTGPYWYWKTGSVEEVVAKLNSEQEFINYNLTIGSIEQGLRISISNYMTRHNIVSKSISVDNVYVGELKIHGDDNYEFEHSIVNYQRCTDNRMDNCGILFNYLDSDGIKKEYCVTDLHDCVNIIKNGILLAIGSRVTYHNGDTIIARKDVKTTGDNNAHQAYRRSISDYQIYRHSNNNAILENCNIITKRSLTLGSICEEIATDFNNAKLCVWKKDDRGNWQPDTISFGALFNGSDFSTLTLSE